MDPLNNQINNHSAIGATSTTSATAATPYRMPPLEFQPPNAKFLAQMISMGPFVFQTARCLKNFGILKSIFKSANEGATIDELKSNSSLTTYSLEVLLDAGVSCRLLEIVNSKYQLTQVGYFIQFDGISDINMNFSQDVCYQGLFNLDTSLQNNKPDGLKTFGDWSTIYEGLTQLPPKTLSSWLDFDHFYSDGAFPRALPFLFAENPKTIMDVGGNTGKFAITCATANPQIKVTLVDHPNQIEAAKIKVRQAELSDQISFYACDLLNTESTLPADYDIIWMSQFLDCFSEDQIIYLLNKVKKSLKPGGSIFIMETFVDNQKFDSAKFCLDMTSLYFTCMANGTSRMYPLTKFVQLIEAAGLKVEKTYENIKIFHTLLKCGI